MEQPNPTRCRILAIDDDPLMCKLLERIVPAADQVMQTSVLGEERHFRFALDSTLSGQEGLQMLQRAQAEQQPYALVYLDMRMPGWDGLTTAGRIRAVDPTVMIIWITAHEDHDRAEIRQHIGANFEFVSKPVDENELLELTCIFATHWERTRNRLPPLVSSPALTKEYALRSAKQPTRIMFVDDSPTVRAVYGELLRQQPHYEVMVAGSLQEAMSLTQYFVPDISILDYYMPGGNGDILAKALLSQKITKNTLILVLTHKEEVEEVMLQAGAIDVLYKDDPTEIFLQRIHSIERYIRSQMDLRRAIEEQAQAELAREQERIAQDRQLAYQSGLTEMSSNVLHNIGNAIAGMGWQVLALQKSINKIHSIKQGLDGGLEIGDLELLQSGLKRAIDDLTKIYKGELSECSDHLSKSIEYVGEVIRVQQSLTQVGALYLRTFQVNEVIQDALLIEKETNRKYHIKVTTAINPAIETLSLPYNQFMQMLGNLLKNSREAIDEARHHSPTEEPQQGRVEIAITPAQRDHHFRLSVRDNGCGIEEERLTSIFQRGETSKKKGSGFGLHSVATFVQSLDGTIYAESEGRGSGATIVIELPTSSG